MATKNIIDVTSTTITANTPGKTLELAGWATLNRKVVPVQLWVYAQAATVGDTGQVILYNSASETVVTVDIDNGPGWYSGTGNLAPATGKFDMHFGNAVGTITIKDFSLIPLIS